MLDFTRRHDEELLELYAELMEELRKRRLIRSSNNPVSDYAENLVRKKLGLVLEKGSNKGYDAIDEKTKEKYQIKARRLTRHNKSKQLGVIRNLEQRLFDYLIAVVFNEDFSVREIWKIPHAKVREYAKPSEHQHGHIFVLAGAVLKDEAVNRL